LQALYSRLKITLGKESLIPNQGVPQGSILSPFLYDIYSEDLLHKLETEEMVSQEDILSYADDLLILCEDLGKIRRIINLVQTWCVENHMRLNVQKSAIVEYIGRHMKKKLLQGSFCDFPVSNEYKYLGLKLSSKLTMRSQLQFIKDKSESLYRKLSPFLHKAELDSRKSLWQLFIQPLVEFLLPLYFWETSYTWIQKANSIIRCSFKLFTGLKVNTSNKVVDILSGFNIQKRARLTYEIYSLKWFYRKRNTKFTFDLLPQPLKDTLNSKKRNFCKHMPFELIKYLNILKSLCPQCGVPNSISHLEYVHNCKVPDFDTILKDSLILQESKIPRRKCLDTIRLMLQDILLQIKICILKQVSIAI
jgi:hypothetical protein